MLGLSRNRTIKVTDELAYEYKQRQDGRWIVFRVFGGSLEQVSSFNKEGAARKFAQGCAALARRK